MSSRTPPILDYHVPKPRKRWTAKRWTVVVVACILILAIFYGLAVLFVLTSGLFDIEG